MVDFKHRVAGLDPIVAAKYEGRMDDAPGIFALMRPMPGAIDAYLELSELLDTYLLSTAQGRKPADWHDKGEWVREPLGAGDNSPAYKRLILTHHKDLNKGDFLVDDRPNNGADTFDGEGIQFGSRKFRGWRAVVKYLRPKA